MVRKGLSAMDSPALRFVLVMGLVNLFGDMTYEGGASINGPYLGMLGASAAAISIIAGTGEFLGYSLRAVAGYVADRTGRYWAVSFAGYALNLLAVPAMALAGSWQTAALLIFAERIGRAIRKPSVESMLSYTTGKLGTGWAFAVNTALDELGATVGPLVVAAILFFRGSYQTAYALLLVSALLAFVSLVAARITFPVPAHLEQKRAAPQKGFSGAYWLYMAAAACFAAGLMSYELISYYLTSSRILPLAWMPVALAFATGCGVLANLALGRMYDRFGQRVVIGAIILSALFTPIVFTGSLAAALIAMPLWGIGYAVQDTLFKAIVADMLPHQKRGLAFGLFYAGYGGGWLVGSVAAGLLYGVSHFAVAAFAMTAQLASLPVFMLASRRQTKHRDHRRST